MARLSVIVPFYGVEAYFDRCLRSIAHQTFDDVEVILVDDGSPDGSLGIAERWAERDGRFRVVRQENQGLGPARNTGVQHASGELLAFVDSDDLLARHAYQLLVGALDSTGSDLAAGNARRFTSLWARQSYTHARPFAETALSTHVGERPSLVLDRMAWNKVYRREFWDSLDLRFPPILYEDYPVTLPAHVLARSVDVLADPVYFWREREGGELSITQARHSLPNLRDRVRSAELVLDFVTDQAPHLLRHVEAHLYDIDVDAVVAALLRADDAERPEILSLAQRLLGRIRACVRTDGKPVERLQSALVDRGDLPRVLEVLEHRDAEGKRAPVVRTSRFPARFAYDLPFRDDPSAGLPEDLFRADRPRVDLSARVTKARWRRGRLRVRGFAHLPGLPVNDRTRTRFWLQHTDGTRVTLPHERHEHVLDERGRVPAGFTLEINPFDLGVPRKRGRWRLRCSVRSQGIQRAGAVTVSTASRAAWLHPEPIGRGVVVQPVTVDGADVVLDVFRARTHVSRVSAFADRIEVEGVLARPADDLALVLRSGVDEQHEIPVGVEEQPDGSLRFLALVDLGELDPWAWAPDPMEEAAPWSVRLRSGGVERRIPVGDLVGVAVARSSTLQLVASRTVRGRLGFTVGPVAGTVSRAVWDEHDDATMLLEGATADPHARDVRVRLVCQVDPEHQLVEEVSTTLSGGVFAARIPVGTLVRLADEADADRPARVRTRVWQAALVEDGVGGRLMLPRALLASAPPATVLEGSEVEVRCGRASSFSIQARGAAGSTGGRRSRRDEAPLSAPADA